MKPTKENNSILAGGEFYVLMLQTELHLPPAALPPPPASWPLDHSRLHCVASDRSSGAGFRINLLGKTSTSHFPSGENRVIWDKNKKKLE